MRGVGIGFCWRRVVPLRLERQSMCRTQYMSTREQSECRTEDRDLPRLERNPKATRRILCRQSKAFSIPLHPVGTDFQLQVWKALLNIPYGATRSYKQIATSIGRPEAVRAVARAIGANGISILIPCHRIIGSNRSLTGYAGGLEAKRMLLQMEDK